MNNGLYKAALKGFSPRLIFPIFLVLLALIAFMLAGGLPVAIAVEDIPEDEHDEDLDSDWDGTAGSWQIMLTEPPEGREIVLIEDQDADSIY
jgi:hypothetical protein